ncbi:MAG: hypothetical protein KUG77_29195 [Nannocystaceae bacterium]|nr:hypothetical protein [Nannocystaceae bacterium]
MANGDDRTGFFGYVQDQATLARVVAGAGSGAAKRLQTLRDIAARRLTPAPHTRLGAFSATSGYAQGTVGYAVNRAIGLLYVSLGTYGEERIGTVFTSGAAIQYYEHPVRGPSSQRVAQMEYDYWARVKREDPWSSGATIATAFDPQTRDWLQREVFSRSP